MTTDRELMQQALNVLKIFVDGGNSAWARKIIEIKEALRDRLAQPEQEPEREWQGLTDEEMMMIYGQNHEGKKYSFGRAIEAKLKEKNNAV